MPYEMLSRALAYVSCLTTASLLATSMAMAAVNVGLMKPAPCGPAACAAVAAKSADPYAGFANKAHIEAVATVLWSKKI